MERVIDRPATGRGRRQSLNGNGAAAAQRCRDEDRFGGAGGSSSRGTARGVACRPAVADLRRRSLSSPAPLISVLARRH